MPSTPLSFLRSERLPLVVLWAATAAYGCAAIVLSLDRHFDYRSGFDLANFDQALWLISRGEEPFVTQHGRLYWGDHFGLTPVLLTPLYLLGGGPATLLVVQALTMSAVAPLLYALARAYEAGRWLASLPALLWLASPLTLTPILFDFHHVPLVAPAIVGSVLALRRDRYVLFALLALLACFAKEDVPLLYVMLGVVVALEGRRRLGLAIAAAAAALFAFAVLVFLPAFTDSFAWFAERFAGERGDSLADVVRWTGTHPVEALGDLLATDNLLVLAVLVLTTGGLCLLAPPWLLLALPTLGHNFVSAYGPQHALVYHYHVPAALAFSIAAAVGVRRLATVSPRARLLFATGVAGGLLAATASVEVAVRGGEERELGSGADRRSAVAHVPVGVAVAASPRLTPHMSQRKDLYTLPLPFFGGEGFGTDLSASELVSREADLAWVLLDTVDRPLEAPRSPERLLELLPRRGFEEVARYGTVHVYARAGLRR